MLTIPHVMISSQEVKISASEIVHNLNITDESGLPIIPPGSLVYISTDDPDGKCHGCTAKGGEDCNSFKPPKPPGCPNDVRSCYVTLNASHSVASYHIVSHRITSYQIVSHR